jgi:cation:H+ antiporter
MAWLLFAISAALLVGAAIKLADYGDAIAVRTRLGGMFVGTLLLAGATSLPEMLTMINALRQQVPNLAAGTVFGSNMANMCLLGVLDLLHPHVRVLRQVALKHALTASLAMLLTVLVVLFLMANIDLQVGWVGLDSLLLVAGYIVAVRLIRGSDLIGPTLSDMQDVTDENAPGLLHAGIGFGVAAAILFAATPMLVRSSTAIAEITGMTTGFVGVVLVAVVTSLPELVTVLAAARIGAYDMAVGNLFGSNIFNILVLAMTDFFYLGGRFLGGIDPGFALAGVLALLLGAMALIGNLVRVERRFLFVEIDALLLMLVYGAGLWLLYVRGIGL